MAHQGHQVDQQRFCCPICLDLLKDPVTTSCGHNYCRSCVNSHWDTEGQRRTYSCPQCKETFRRRPVLKKNTMLADLMEDMKKTGLQPGPADHCNAGPEDVACDVCTRRKLKAHKSCLQCLASFCEEHLQTHFHAPPLKKHKLMEPFAKLQENICSVHDEVMKMFCRTDQQSICHICVMDLHKGHDTVSAAAERTERQREFQENRPNIHWRIRLREIHVQRRQRELEVIRRVGNETVKNSERIFNKLIRLVKQQVRSQQQIEVSLIRELQEKLEQEISELKRKDKELEKLSHTQDHNKFLQVFHSLSQLRDPTDSSWMSERPVRNFKDVTAAVSELTDKLQDFLRVTWTNFSETVPQLDVLLPQPVPRTRAGLLRCSRDITLDPNTAYKRLLLSDGNRKVTLMSEDQPYPDHPDRFTYYGQVLSKEGLTGRCYWEVKLDRGVHIAVSYKSIDRGEDFGCNDKSWQLERIFNKYILTYKGTDTTVSGPRSSRVGVYLDHSAGILCFFNVSKTMTLIHRVQTTFTEPLHAGLTFHSPSGASAELCKLK